MAVTFISRNKHVILYGISLAALLLLLNWLRLRFIIVDHAFEIYAGSIAVVFTVLGIWLSSKLTKPKIKTITIEKEVLVEKEVFINNTIDFVQNQKEIDKLGLSKREIEVLELMATGLSNQEIGEKLFISLNTVKTHSTKLFEKLDVKRRTQAVEKAKKLSLIP